jgi:hypothetical protein
MLGLLEGHYSVDLMCDPEVQRFYESLGGWTRTTGMSIRDYDRQASGIDAGDR